jgi:hypothetical protein
MSLSMRGQAASFETVFKTVVAGLDRAIQYAPAIPGSPAESVIADPLASDDDLDLIAPLSRDG